MRIGISLLLLSTCAMGAGREEYKRDFTKSVALAPKGGLRVEHSLGSVNIRTQAKNEVSVVAAIRCSADSMETARRFGEQIQIRVEQTGAGVSVRTEYPHENNQRNLGYSVSLEITMPDSAPLDVRNRFGQVTVQNLHAAATINNANGNVVFTGGRGRQRIENSFGLVEVISNEGDVAVNNSNGNVRATDINGEAILSSRFGEIRAKNISRGLTITGGNSRVEVDQVGGAAAVTNTFGDVVVRDAKSNITVHNQNGRVDAAGVAGTADLNTTFAPVKFTGIGKGVTVRAENSQVTGDTVGEAAAIETSFGGVDVRNVKGGAQVTAQNSSIRLADVGGDIRAKTSFAGTTIENAGGAVTVESSNGAVTAAARAGQACKAMVLRTSFAPIKVTVPAGAGYNVSAHTTFGKIRSEPEITVSGQLGADAVEGRIGGGGCELHLNNQSGNIDIVKR